jgi:3-isopropylmalate/(R)-2-methylmalate dehydratase small subunit
MESFTRLTGASASLPQANVDTDIIFPARFLLITAKKGLGKYAFYEWRYEPSGAERPDFVLNQPAFRGAEILVTGENFGCGSSREQAPWALRDLGVRCIIATSFGEIFYGNCFQNGILPVVAPEADLVGLHADAAQGLPITVDLVRQEVIRPGGNGEVISFDLEPWRRDALLNGWDEVDIILNTSAGDIAAFETTQRQASPWLYDRG